MPTLIGDQLRTTPDTSGVSWWSQFTPPWEQRVDKRAVDADRTARLVQHDDRVRTNPGVPLQLAGPKMHRVQHRSQPGTLFPFNPLPTVPLPLQDQVWVEQRTTDHNWFAVDPEKGLYYEASEMGPVFAWASTPWKAGYIRVFDLNLPWDKQRASITGGGLPMWPMTPRIEDLNNGEQGVQHALHFIVSGGYSTEPFIPPAVKTDGTKPGHPLRAGARMRLTEAAYYQLSARAKTAHDRAVLWAVRNYGVIVNDRTAPVGHAMRFPASPDLNLTLQLRLTDFEVVI